MDLHELDMLLNNSDTLKAPSDFTQKVMARVYALDNRAPTIKPSFKLSGYGRWGFSCLAAGLIILLINLSPAFHLFSESHLHFKGRRDDPPAAISIVSQAVDNFAKNTSSILTRPFDHLLNFIRKEC